MMSYLEKVDDVGMLGSRGALSSTRGLGRKQNGHGACRRQVFQYAQAVLLP